MCNGRPCVVLAVYSAVIILPVFNSNNGAIDTATVCHWRAMKSIDVFQLRHPSPKRKVRWNFHWIYSSRFLIVRFMGPTCGPSGTDRTQVGPFLTPWILLSGLIIVSVAWYLKNILYKNTTHTEHFIWTIDTNMKSSTYDICIIYTYYLLM